MGQHDWWQNTSWNEDIEAAFFKKFVRARNKSLYLPGPALPMARRAGAHLPRTGSDVRSRERSQAGTGGCEDDGLGLSISLESRSGGRYCGRVRQASQRNRGQAAFRSSMVAEEMTMVMAIGMSRCVARSHRRTFVVSLWL